MFEKATVASIPFILFLLQNFFTLLFGIEVHNITQSQPLLPGQILSSPGRAFQLGFFTLDDSSNHYVGIWYANIVPQTVFWVANREKPVTNSSASLKIDFSGNLVLVDGQNNFYWSTNIFVASNNSVAGLSDVGHFYLKDTVTGIYVWHTMENLCDTLLPEVNFLWVKMPGRLANRLISWRSENDPAPGDFVVGLATQKLPQIFVWNGSKPYWRSGQWNTSKFVGSPDFATSRLLGASDLVSLDVVTHYYANNKLTSDENAFRLTRASSSILSNLVVSSKGSLKLMHWAKDKGWYTSWEAPNSECDIYGACGPNGFCQKSEPLICECLDGFIPQSHEEWEKQNWTRGCRRHVKLLCQSNRSTLRFPKGKADEFWKISGLKLPDSADSFNIKYPNLCHQWCISNCSCNAYAFVSGIGCMTWSGDLIDTQKLSVGGQDLFLRVAPSELAERKLVEALIISSSAILIATILGVTAFGLCRRKDNQTLKRNGKNVVHISTETPLQYIKGSHLEGQESLLLPFFEFESILVATDNFNEANKLGQGGFGSVYKGMLLDGKEVAIKRLSSTSGQGMEEFKNETMLISKLQHRNLVTLVGYCIARAEKILIYEYMSNKSLDTFLFDPIKKEELDWVKRFNIIQGVAQGLLYLHCYSRLRIIHRDLKVGNILLDEEMNPKISDFGLARMFQGTQDLASTRRVVGTLGYMSPEYALGGIFSEKSDVFSFGVLVLEIISGKRSCFQDDHQHLSLISHASKLWSENKALDLMDETLADSFQPPEVMKCVKIALVCVQDQAADRPNMASVISMLSSKEMLEQPKEPTLTFQVPMKGSFQKESSRKGTANEVTLSPIVGR